MRFDILWRDTSQTDHVLASVTHAFDPSPNRDAVQFEADLKGKAAPAVAGDLLILKFSPVDGDPNAFYTPNGDGARVNGRIPQLTLP